jgi:HD-GYP domain-containing protein (c-di-GMP phosphodiesterase class II)
MRPEDVTVGTLGEVAGLEGAVKLQRMEDADPPMVVVARAEELPAGTEPAPGTVLVALGRMSTTCERVIAVPVGEGESLEVVVQAARCLALESWRRAWDEEVIRRQAELERELLGIGASLTTERNLRTLLERILTAARRLVRADAGSLYLVETGTHGERRLRFVLAQNDSTPLAWRESVLPLDQSSMAGTAALTGEPVVVEDAYALPADSPFTFNRSFDEQSGYRSRSVLAVSMTTRAGDTVGVLQLINRKRTWDTALSDEETTLEEVIPFTTQDLDLLRSLAAQAAVVLENSRLVEEIQRLFESFVAASVTAIEQRDPPTSGHSFRVAARTLGLAEAVNRTPSGPYGKTRFSAEEMRQLRYAALLHDVGKVGVREAVLTKEARLYPFQERLVRERFLHATRALQLDAAMQLLRRSLDGESIGPQSLQQLEAEMERIRREMEALLAAVEAANRPTVLPGRLSSALDVIAAQTFHAPDGTPRPLLEPEELRLLKIEKGNLDPAERLEIQSHVVHSQRFLMTLPWPRGLERVPEIAARHHEKLNGTGYPAGLTGKDLPVEVRMLTICDIFDALTAGDRPYKPRLEPESAVEILVDEAREGALDHHLVDLFVEAGLHTRPVTLTGF